MNIQVQLKPASPIGRSPLPFAGAAKGLRLALFSGNYNYTRDGANQALNRLVAFMQAAGAEVRVYSPTSAKPAFEPNGELVSIPSIPLPGRAEYRVGLGLPRRLREDVETFSPTLVHLSAPDLIGHAALALGERLGVPVVSSLHTRFETYLRYYGLGWLEPWATKRLAAFYGRCDRVLAPNAPLQRLLHDQGMADRVRIWSRGVDRLQFSPARRDLAWRRSLGFRDEETVILFLGRLVREKGLDAFADAIDRVAEAGLPARVLVVGDGPARGWFEARLPTAVFTGQLVGEPLGRAVASADILLNPSRTEAFGNVTLEAMAAGLVVVCRAAPSTSALVVSGLNGVLCGEGRTDYAEALARLLSNPALRARIGHAARRTSAAYGWDAASAAVLDVYREVGGIPSAR